MTRVFQPGTQRPVESSVARRFFLLTVALYAIAGGLARVLIWISTAPPPGAGLIFPPAFWLSSLLLGSGSWWLQNALDAVRREKQVLFRHNLLRSLAAGTGFVSLQSYGLWYMLQAQNPQEVSTSVSAFILVVGTLHAMHFTVALMFLAFITVNAFADRYDHEYYWGVTVCTYFWHVLGVVWLAVLAIFVIAM